MEARNLSRTFSSPADRTAADPSTASPPPRCDTLVEMVERACQEVRLPRWKPTLQRARLRSNRGKVSASRARRVSDLAIPRFRSEWNYSVTLWPLSKSARPKARYLTVNLPILSLALVYWSQPDTQNNLLPASGILGLFHLA